MSAAAFYFSGFEVWKIKNPNRSRAAGYFLILTWLIISRCRATGYKKIRNYLFSVQKDLSFLYQTQLRNKLNIPRPTYHIGNIRNLDRKDEFGTVWDHGTMMFYIASPDHLTLLQRYMGSLQQDGKALIADQMSGDLRELHTRSKLPSEIVEVERDEYQTTLNIPAMMGTGTMNHSSFFNKGTLVPYYSRPCILQVEKR